MSAMLDPMNASIDGVIHWLRDQRRTSPKTPLPQLIDLSGITVQRLTDLACIDLIECNRLGHPHHVEDLLRDIPELAKNDSARLDLIDAELCVRMELKLPIDLNDYSRRFPDLAHAIEALAKLDHASPIELSPPDLLPPRQEHSIRPHEATIGSTDHGNLSFELAPVARDRSPAVRTSNVKVNHGTNMLDHLVEPPPWFIRERVQSSSERSCVIRGRDSNENRAVAMKIIRLANATTKREIDLQLQAIEAASNVRHPAWVTPDVAAVESQSLAVIRPWIFGIRWDQARRHATPQTRLQDLARIGYALQSAHDTPAQKGSAAHGGLHLNNLIVDAAGQVQILDAGASIQPAAGEIFGVDPSSGSDHDSLSERRRHSDVRSLCALVRMSTASNIGTDANFRRQASMVDRLCEQFIAAPDQQNACAKLSDAAAKLADGNLSEPANHQLSAIAKSFWNRLIKRSRAARNQ